MLLGNSSDESSSFFSLLDVLKSPKRSSKGSPTLVLLDVELDGSWLGVGEEGEFLNSLLAGIDLFAFWRVYLMSVGFSHLYNKSSNSTLSILMGLWIFGLIIFAGMGSFFAGMAG